MTEILELNDVCFKCFVLQYKPRRLNLQSIQSSETSRSHLSRTGRPKLPKAEWNAPASSLLQLAQRPPRRADRTPVKEHSGDTFVKLASLSDNNTQVVPPSVERYLLKGVEGDLQAPGSFLPTDLRGPVDVLKDKLDWLGAAVSAVDDIALLVHYDGGSGWARGLQL